MSKVIHRLNGRAAAGTQASLFSTCTHKSFPKHFLKSRKRKVFDSEEEGENILRGGGVLMDEVEGEDRGDRQEGEQRWRLEWQGSHES